MGKSPSGLRGWTDIRGGIDWAGYGGRWARRAKDSSWYILDFTNMWTRAGATLRVDREYVCEVKRVDLSDISEENLKRARECVGLDLNDVDEADREIAQVEACVSYGCAQPLNSFEGSSYPARIRAEARRYAETCMRDAKLTFATTQKPFRGSR